MTEGKQEKERKRKSNRKRKAISAQVRGSKTLCLPMERTEYSEIMKDAKQYRIWLDGMYEKYPELFPTMMSEGYALHDRLPLSKKLPEIQLRRIALKANEEVYTVRPSFVLPYMSGYTDEVEKGLFLLSFGVPFWAISRVFGRNDMYWERLTERLGHNSLVGTTVRKAEALPQDLVADEKHTELAGKAAYIATTVGGECVLGAALSPSASADDLHAAYDQFRSEARNLAPTYQPKTVNTDGWTATSNVWVALFPQITLILCFLHAFLKIHDRCKGLKQTYFDICQRVWVAYHATTATAFHVHLADLAIWSLNTLPEGAALDSILKLCGKAERFAIAYSFPTAHRTSNMVDRHMQLMDAFLFAGKAFHGHLMTAEFRIRAWALLHNFRPFCPRSPCSRTFHSRAHRLNRFLYHDNWLHNLLISSSMAGFRA
jgi:hypothetical protein